MGGEKVVVKCRRDESASEMWGVEEVVVKCGRGEWW